MSEKKKTKNHTKRGLKKLVTAAASLAVVAVGIIKEVKKSN